ncbi:hypothetical protein FOL47_007837 [Perkinsus chesapeaki]|uniref:Uncharacterized protein n=1 Tax=Perkinsus chesapeaki TaxID=330153 RepID=A0A7J6MUU3_PERCH|nr:hypothetical protein FOL47_007837 [Perkinsus chesapeaki]
MSLTLDLRYRRPLAKCSEMAIRLLENASAISHVVIVTLATAPWVTISIQNFMPELGPVIERLKIPVIYAKETVSPEEQRRARKAGLCVPAYMKEVAMKKQLKLFYSRYEMQSWKNVLSIGDSVFERRALQEVIADRNYDQNFSKICRKKTMKMISHPSITQLIPQLEILSAWIPYMLAHDGDFDLDIEDNQECLLRLHDFICRPENLPPVNGRA